MSDVFRFEDLRPLELADRAVVETALLASPEQSCEFAFSNLFNWCGSYHTRWTMFDGLLCLWMETNDMLLLAETGRPMRTEDCLAVSGEMQRAGHSGILHHIRRETLERLPDLEKSFRADVMPDEFGEYLLKNKNEILHEVLLILKEKNERILNRISAEGSGDSAKRKGFFEREKKLIRVALSFYDI